MEQCPWIKSPFDVTNLRARIRSDCARIEEIDRRREIAAKAEAAGGVLVAGNSEYVSVTFAEKPPRETLDALRAAGFSWGGGSWNGRHDKLPPGIEMK